MKELIYKSNRQFESISGLWYDKTKDSNLKFPDQKTQTTFAISFQPSEHDEYSNAVCYSCWGLVHTFNDFYKKVEDAHKNHQKTHPQHNMPKVSKIETQSFQQQEEHFEDQIEDDSNFMDDDYDDPLNPNPSVSVSEEYEPEVIPAKRKRQLTYKGRST